MGAIVNAKDQQHQICRRIQTRWKQALGSLNCCDAVLAHGAPGDRPALRSERNRQLRGESFGLSFNPYAGHSRLAQYQHMQRLADTHLTALRSCCRRQAQLLLRRASPRLAG